MNQRLKQATIRLALTEDDKEWVEQALELMGQAEWATQIDNVAAMRRSLRERISPYLSRFDIQALKTNPSVLTQLEEALALCIEAETVWKERAIELGDVWLYTFGDDNLTFSPQKRDWINDFKRIKIYLENKPAVLQHLLPLAQIIAQHTAAGQTSPLTALKIALAQLENKAGFAGLAQIPRGLLPLEDFLKLMQDGQVIDDFGAGLQHGELTHRLHWYSIIKAYQAKVLQLNHPPIEVYKAINSADLGQGRDGNSLWGELFDQSITASSPHYCDGGTLNRDLLEADPNWDRINIGLAERDVDYVKPNTSGLKPIGQALSELRKIRIHNVEVVATPAEKRASAWVDYGFPPPSIVKILG